MESGALPIRWIIAQRRIVYRKHIMSKYDTELVKQVFMAQQDNPSKGDFVTLVSKYLNDLKVTYELATTGALSRSQLKSKLKKNAINWEWQMAKHIPYFWDWQWE